MHGKGSSAVVRSLLAWVVVAVVALPGYSQELLSPGLNPSTLKAMGKVDPRFLSYNIEMVEVTGGRFWRPYKSSMQKSAAVTGASPHMEQQVGADTAMFEYRPPIDLYNARLRKLAAALGPAYVRVSGSWANSTYFQNDDRAAVKTPPKGFSGVLTRREWKGVVDFSRAVDAPIVTSVAVSPGARDMHGDWDSGQAAARFEYTKSIGGRIAATEFMNEPSIPGPNGAPNGYDAPAFGRDVHAFDSFLRKDFPHVLFLGPSAVAEGVSLLPSGGAAAGRMKLLPVAGLMKSAPPVFDAFSYHFYGAVSHRCGGNLSLEQAMTSEWFDRTDTAEAFYSAVRDKYLPGKPIWLTETAEAACGGDLIAGQFVDTFRYLNQLGSLAQRGVKVVMRNTLASSDYGLLDEDTYDPRPDYWAALLWKRTMGDVVLNPRVPKDQKVRIYASCMHAKKGGVTLLLLNTDTQATHNVSISEAGKRFTLTAPELTSTTVLLNGAALNAAPDGSVPVLHAVQAAPGETRLPPASITFLTLPSAHNRSCGQ